MNKTGAEKHWREIKRWVNSNSSWVWRNKAKNCTWVKINDPSFLEEFEYVVDDEWAELRKAQIDGKQLQFNDLAGTGWIDRVLDEEYMSFTEPEDWRIKPEIEFPIYCRSKAYNLIVKFIGRKEGIVVMSDGKPYQIGHTDNHLVPFDYATWEPVETVKIDGATLFDTQPVLAWNEEETMRTIGFFDAENKCLFTSLGHRSGMCYDNYAPVENIEPWTIEAWEKLEI